MFSIDHFGMNSSFGPNAIWYDEAGHVISSPFGSQVSSLATNNPVAIMGTVIMGIGIVMMIAGVILAIYLKRQANDAEK
jgi:hypothetical protein